MNNSTIDSERLERSQRRRSSVRVLVITTIASGLFFGCPSPPPKPPQPDCKKFEDNPSTIPPASESWSGKCCYHEDNPSRLGTVVIEPNPTGGKRARCNF